MIQSHVDEMLKNYREYVGKCGSLEAEIEETERMINELNRTALSDACIGAQRFDGMPHGSEVSNPTERLGLMFASGHVREEVVQLTEKLEELKREYREKYPTVRFVSAWLQGLTEKERWLIEQQVIDGVCWREVVARHRLKFGEDYSKDGLKRIKARALEKIYKYAA